MKKKRLAVCDSDPLYASNLADYINRTTNMPCEASAFTDMESYEKYAACSQIDILLVDKEMYEEKEADRVHEAGSGGGTEERDPAEGTDGGMNGLGLRGSPEAYDCEVIYLADEVSDVYHENAGYYASVNAGKHRRVNKYQAADRLLDDIRVICVQSQAADTESEGAAPTAAGRSSGEEDAEAVGNVKVLAVYSPVGRCGKTVFAVALGEALSRNEKVLYLNMENYHAFEQENGRENGRENGDISDLIFEIRKGREDLMPHMRSMVCSFRCLDYLPPVRTISDLKEIRYTEWMTLIRTAGRAGYDTVILDAGGQIGDIFEVLSACTKIYVPCLKDPVSQIKTDRFRENLRLCGMTELQRKMIFLAMPTIPDEELRDYPMRAVRGKMGTFVKRVLAEER